jgi:hypothetical protein
MWRFYLKMQNGSNPRSTMDYLVFVALGVMIMALIFMLAPVIGGKFEAVTPNLTASSAWNASYNSKIMTGASFYSGVVPFIYLGSLVSVAFTIIWIIRNRN